MGIAMLVTSIPILIFAVVLSKGKGIGMIAGYNTMSDEEIAQYDEVAICKFTGKIMYGVSFSLWITALGDWFVSQLLIVIGMIMMFLIAIFAAVYSNKNRDRFKKKIQED